MSVPSVCTDVYVIHCIVHLGEYVLRQRSVVTGPKCRVSSVPQGVRRFTRLPTLPPAGPTRQTRGETPHEGPGSPQLRTGAPRGGMHFFIRRATKRMRIRRTLFVYVHPQVSTQLLVSRERESGSAVALSDALAFRTIEFGSEFTTAALITLVQFVIR